MLIVRKNQVFPQTYCVEMYSRAGAFLGVVSGMGRNRGTWDSEAQSKRTAQRWARICRTDDPVHVYRVSEGA